MTSLLMHIGVGGVVGAAGALFGGLIVVGLRLFVTKRARARQMERIRQIGIVGATKQALFDVPEPELDFSGRRASG
jgi:hypothetical protein